MTKMQFQEGTPLVEDLTDPLEISFSRRMAFEVRTITDPGNQQYLLQTVRHLLAGQAVVSGPPKNIILPFFKRRN